MAAELNAKDLDQISTAIKGLTIRKKWKLNFNGTKVKVVRDNENEFSTYLNGHMITTDDTWQKAFDLVVVLLKGN
jgi:hypothetical protein